ncbi:hypothetical protein KM917_10745 [Virgibacillus pantothenticus]|nr:hypothetical protein [Virgibacillus pantothenticus]
MVILMWLEVSNLNSQLIHLNQLISSSNIRLQEKREELRRLNETLTKLQQNKNDFLKKKDTCIQPEFTTKNFHGKLANEVQSFRENQLQISFLAIPRKYLKKAKNIIMDQIRKIEQEIAAIESNITSWKREQAMVTKQKREVENQIGVDFR